jgi:hypothetical protein
MSADCHQTAQHCKSEERSFHELEDLEQQFFFSGKKYASTETVGGAIFLYFPFIYLRVLEVGSTPVFR